MKVYILTTGIQVERYEIASVHSSMERALEEKNRRDDFRDNDIKEYEVDPELTPIKKGFELGKVYRVNVRIDIRVPYENVKREEELTKYRHPEKCEISCHTYIKGNASIEVSSPISYEHAEKVALEEKEKFLKSVKGSTSL